jgi:hypothetical protein
VPGQHPRLRWSREVRDKQEEEDPKMAALIKRWEALQRAKRSGEISRVLPRLYPSVKDRMRHKRDTAEQEDWQTEMYQPSDETKNIDSRKMEESTKDNEIWEDDETERKYIANLDVA